MSGCQQFNKSRVDTRLWWWWWCFFFFLSEFHQLHVSVNCCIGQTPFTLYLHSKLLSDRIGGAWRFRVAPGYKPPNDCHEIWSHTKRCNSTNSFSQSRLFVAKHGGSETVNVSSNLPFCVPWMSLHGARPHGRLVRPDVVTDEIVSNKQTNKQILTKS